MVPQRAGTEGANFDPDKPTIIFTHGMKITEGYNRRDLVSLWVDTNAQFQAKGYDPYMYYDQYFEILLEMGYNVGHFYWNQLSEISIDQDYRVWTSDIYDEDGKELAYQQSGSLYGRAPAARATGPSATPLKTPTPRSPYCSARPSRRGWARITANLGDWSGIAWAGNWFLPLRKTSSIKTSKAP